jgi:hypothetical protein
MRYRDREWKNEKTMRASGWNDGKVPTNQRPTKKRSIDRRLFAFPFGLWRIALWPSSPNFRYACVPREREGSVNPSLPLAARLTSKKFHFCVWPDPSFPLTRRSPFMRVRDLAFSHSQRNRNTSSAGHFISGEHTEMTSAFFRSFLRARKDESHGFLIREFLREKAWRIYLLIILNYKVIRLVKNTRCNAVL